MKLRHPSKNMWMPWPPRQPVVTLTLRFKNLIRSSVGAIECSLSFTDIAQAIHDILW